MKFHHRRSQEVEEGESYYVSMTDMMVGVVFIFIIMLSYFALQFRSATVELTTSSASASSSNSTADADQADLIASVGSDLMAEQINPSQEKGGLTFSASQLFEPDSATLSANGRDVVAKVAQSLVDRLPCFADGVKASANCPAGKSKIQSINVGAHSSVNPATPDGREAADLTLQRSAAFYAALMEAKPALDDLRGSGGGKMVRVSSSVTQTSGSPTPAIIAIQFKMAH